jgi:plasmid maintenance system killer protein
VFDFIIEAMENKGSKLSFLEEAICGRRHKKRPARCLDKRRKMLAFLDDMEDPEELWALPSWKVHTLTRDRKGTWTLSVTANRRLTFRIDTGE